MLDLHTQHGVRVAQHRLTAVINCTCVALTAGSHGGNIAGLERPDLVFDVAGACKETCMNKQDLYAKINPCLINSDTCNRIRPYFHVPCLKFHHPSHIAYLAQVHQESPRLLVMHLAFAASNFQV